jgi:hypothetical protein
MGSNPWASRYSSLSCAGSGGCLSSGRACGGCRSCSSLRSRLHSPRRLCMTVFRSMLNPTSRSSLVRTRSRSRPAIVRSASSAGATEFSGHFGRLLELVGEQLLEGSEDVFAAHLSVELHPRAGSCYRRRACGRPQSLGTSRLRPSDRRWPWSGGRRWSKPWPPRPSGELLSCLACWSHHCPQGR